MVLLIGAVTEVPDLNGYWQNGLERKEEINIGFVVSLRTGGVMILSPIDVTETLSARFQKYLLDHLNGETPANYFARYKKVLSAATSLGYFKTNPSLNIPVKANKNKRRKNNLEAEEYIQLLNTPTLNEEVKEAFIFCCYTGLRWCDVKQLTCQHIKVDAILITILQRKQPLSII